MKPESVRKSVATVSMLAGVAWIGFATVFPLFRYLRNGMDSSDWFFAIIMLPLMAVPGAIALYCGKQLFHRFDEFSLKWIIGTAAFLGVLRTFSLLSSWFSHLVPENLSHSIFPFLSVLLVIPAYLFAVKLLLPLIGGERRKARELLSRLMVGVIAFLLFGLLSDLFETYAPIEEGYTHILEFPWDLLSFVIPILVPVILYKIAVRHLPPAPAIPGILEKKHRSFRLS